jgi:hypothetical protein
MSPWRWAGTSTPRPGGKPVIDFIFAPSDAAVTKGDRLRELAGPYLPPQVITAIIDTLFRFKLVERYEFQCRFPQVRRYLRLHK